MVAAPPDRYAPTCAASAAQSACSLFAGIFVARAGPRVARDRCRLAPAGLACCCARLPQRLAARSHTQSRSPLWPGLRAGGRDGSGHRTSLCAFHPYPRFSRTLCGFAARTWLVGLRTCQRHLDHARLGKGREARRHGMVHDLYGRRGRSLECPGAGQDASRLSRARSCPLACPICGKIFARRQRRERSRADRVGRPVGRQKGL